MFAVRHGRGIKAAFMTRDEALLFAVKAVNAGLFDLNDTAVFEEAEGAESKHPDKIKQDKKNS